MRILNASPSRFYRIRIDEHPMYLIGRDAGTLPAPVPVDELLLTPGERADVLVRGERDPVDVFLPSELPYSIEPLSAPASTGVRTFTMSEAPA